MKLHKPTLTSKTSGISKPTIDYEEGDKIKIYLNENEGNFTCTFGEVIGVKDPKNPVVVYKDYSSLSVRSFKRFVAETDIIMAGDFYTHFVRPKVI